MEWFKKIEEIFTIEKIKEDISHYLNLPESGTSDIVYEIHGSGNEQIVPYSSDDPHVIVSIKITKGYNGMSYIPIIVEVGIGTFTKHPDFNFYEVAKCTADLLYNEDLELISIDFYRKAT
jgi:hypothetical protein